MSLTADNVKASKLRCERILTPEWSEPRDEKAHVWIRELPGEEMDLANDILCDDGIAKDDPQRVAKINAAFCVLCACDESRQPIFTKEDIPVLLKRSLAPLFRCGRMAIDFNGMSDNAIEDAEKNSESGPTK